MKNKIRIADIVNAFELGLIDREQTESKLFDLLVVGITLPSWEKMEIERNKMDKWYEDNRTPEQISLDYRMGYAKGFGNCHKWIKEGN